MLSRLAAEANVAQFVSFGPGHDLPQRHSCLRGHPPGHRFATAEEAVGALLALAPAGSVNVRSFLAGAPKGGPFSYGLTRRDDVLAVLRARAADGLHTIANETVDVARRRRLRGRAGRAGRVRPRGHAPFGRAARHRRPRPRPGHGACCATVYGFTPDLDGRPGERVEFSLHPLVAGVRQTHTIVWERERVDPVRLTHRLSLAQPVQPPARGQGLRPAGRRPPRPPRPGHHRRRAAGRPVPLRPPHRERRALDPHLPGRAGAGQVPDPAGLAGSLRPPGRRGPVGDGHRRRARPGGRPGPVVGGRPPRQRRRAAGRGRRRVRRGLHARPAGPGPAPGPGRSTTSGGSGPGPPPPSARSASSGPTTAPTPGWSSSTWPRRPRPAPPSTRGRRPAGAASTRPSGLEHLRQLIATVAPDEGIELTGDVGVTSHAGDLLRRA